MQPLPRSGVDDPHGIHTVTTRMLTDPRRCSAPRGASGGVGPSVTLAHQSDEARRRAARGTVP
ncbi:hypothetical protein, partial [Microbacterium sp.]|uniref:hypothetical protein n=1 Tax=Microbacterium sp. TaxID=51671 RepID=UPI002628CD94